jgi:hypothetical protein
MSGLHQLLDRQTRTIVNDEDGWLDHEELAAGLGLRHVFVSRRFRQQR